MGVQEALVLKRQIKEEMWCEDEKVVDDGVLSFKAMLSLVTTFSVIFNIIKLF